MSSEKICILQSVNKNHDKLAFPRGRQCAFHVEYFCSNTTKYKKSVGPRQSTHRPLPPHSKPISPFLNVNLGPRLQAKGQPKMKWGEADASGGIIRCLLTYEVFSYGSLGIYNIVTIFSASLPHAVTLKHCI